MAKLKIPKKLGGVKVPKVLRKSKPIGTLLNDPLGRELLAGALIAGAGAAASALAKQRPSVDQLAGAGSAVAEAGGAAAAATGDAVGGAATAISSALRDLAGRLSSQNKDRSSKKKRAARSQGDVGRELGTGA